MKSEILVLMSDLNTKLEADVLTVVFNDGLELIWPIILDENCEM